jgi:hypothetical protein
MIEAKGLDVIIDSNGHGFELDANRICEAHSLYHRDSDLDIASS